MAHKLSKSTFIRGAQCLKSLYLHKKRPFLRDKLPAAQLAKFKRGNDIGKLAQQLYPGGIDVRPKSPSQYNQSVRQTLDLIHKTNTKVIYEATFQYDDVLIMLDMLIRQEGGWLAIEVKSSKAISETYLLDAALQYYVLSQQNIEIIDFELMHIDTSYTFRSELNLNELFIKKSVLNEIMSRQAYVKELIIHEKETLELKNSPQIAIGPQCRKPYPCDFIGHCWKHVKSPNILELNLWDEQKSFDVYHHQRVEAELQTLTDPYQQLAYCYLDGKNYISPELQEQLKLIQPPAFIHLFAQVSALPLADGDKPYQYQAILAVLKKPDGQPATYNTYKKTNGDLSGWLNDQFAGPIICFQLPGQLIEGLPMAEKSSKASNNIMDLETKFYENQLALPALKGHISMDAISSSLLKYPFSRNWEPLLYQPDPPLEKIEKFLKEYVERLELFFQFLLRI